jgi:hypothetical protein
VRAGFDQQAEHIEAAVLRQCGKRCDGFGVFHISIMIEISAGRQEHFNGC